MITVRAAIELPPSSLTTWCPSRRSSAIASAGTLMRAPNFSAWMTARPASSEPEIPEGKPR